MACSDLIKGNKTLEDVFKGIDDLPESERRQATLDKAKEYFGVLHGELESLKKTVNPRHRIKKFVFEDKTKEINEVKAKFQKQIEEQADDSFSGIDSILDSEVNLPESTSEAQETGTETEVNLPQTTEISTTLNDYSVKVENGDLNISPKFGNKELTRRERNKVIEQYIETTDFDSGKKADFSNKGNLSPEQITEVVISESQNPVEIAQEIENVRRTASERAQNIQDSKQGAIAKALQGVRVSKESFSNVDDANNIPDINPFYFSSRNKSKTGTEGNLDNIREVAQTFTNEEVSMQDIADFMKENRNPNDISENVSETTELEQKFKQLTGLNPDDATISKVLNTEVETTNTNVADNTEAEVPFQTESRQQPINGDRLKSLVDRLKKTGLSNNVRIVSDEQIKEALKRLGIESDQTPLGLVDNGSVLINQEKAKSDTPIHEFGHLWASFSKENNRDIYDRGIELIRDSEYHNSIKENPAYKNLSEELILEEALAQAIGEKGVKILNESRKSKFNSWFKNLFTRIAKGLGIRSLSGKQLLDITLEKFTDLVAAELLSGKSVTGQETKTSKTKVDESDVNSIDVVIAEQEAIKETRDKLTKKFNDSKSFVSDIKKELVNYIKANIDRKRVNEIQKRELNTLLRSVQTAKTKNNLLKSFNKVNDIVTELDNRIIKRKIDKILGSRLSKKESGRRKANITDEQAETVLNSIKANIGVKAADRDTKIIELIDQRNALQEKEVETELTEEENLELQSIGISLDILSAITSKDVNKSNIFLSESLEQIEEIFTDGRSRLKELKEQRKIEDESTISNLEEDANPEGKSTTNTVEDLKNEANRAGNTVSRLVRKMTHTWFRGKLSGSLDSIATFISKKGGQNRDSSAWVQLVNQLKKRETLKKTRVRKFANKWKNTQKEIFGSVTRADAVLNKMVKIKKQVLDEESGKTNTKEVDYSISQLLNVWQNNHNERLRAGLEANGFTQEVIENIENILPKKAKDYGERLFSLYEEMYTDANEVYKNINFHSLGKPDFYAGKVHREGTKIEENTDALLGGNARIGTTGYSSQKERVFNKKPINAMDVNRLFSRHLHESSHYVAFAESHRVYNKILKDNRIQKAIILNNGINGEQILNTLLYYKVRDLEQGGERGNKVVDTIGRNVARSVLALKTKIGITQTISIINGSFDLPNNLKTSEFIENYNPVSLIKNVKFLLNNSEYMKNRYDIQGLENAVLGLENITRDSDFKLDNATLESKRRAAARFYKRAIDLMLINVRFGDMVGVLGATPVYSAWKSRFLKQGLSEEQASKKAMEKFEASVDRAQQSISSFGKSEIQKHPYLRYIMMFATAPIQNFQNANFHRRELVKSLRGKQYKGTNTRNALAFLNYQFAQPMLYTYLSNILAGGIISAVRGLASDEEESSEADKALLSSAILGNVQSIPIIGGTLLLLLDKVVLEKEFSFGTIIGSPVYDEIDKITNHISKANTSKKEETKKKHIFEAIKKTSGIMAGIPNISFDAFNELESVYWNDDISTEAKVYRALGYSRSVIKEKTGEDIGKSTTKKRTKRKKRNDG